MNSMVVVMFAMELVSVMLAVILATAWNSFGRPRHALTWCAAFAIAAVNWVGNILLQVRPNDAWLTFVVSILSMTIWTVLLAGFRQRRRLTTSGWVPMVVVAVAVSALIAATRADHRGLMAAIPLMFAAVMLALSAATMITRGDRGPAERAVITMLLAFAILEVVAGGIALRQGASGDAGELVLFQALMMLTMPAAFVGVGLFAVFLLAADLAERMGRLASSDPLTGVLNRRGFEEAATRAVANARRQDQPLTVVMADLDHFKLVNDRYGHGVGDLVLCRFAEHVCGSIRAGDLFARIGGEEFAILLVDASPSAALDAIDRLRIALGRMDIHAGSETIRITASFGVTGPSAPGEELASIMERADSALYRSKMGGRDRVTMAPLPATMAALPADMQLLAEAADAALLVSGTAAR